MKVTIEEEELKQIIKKYFSEVENTNINIGFTEYYDYQYSTTIPVISKDIEIGGIKLKASEEIHKQKLKEIFNYYLSDEYKMVNAYLSSYKVYDQREEYDTHFRAYIEFDPVNQKVRGRNM